MPICSKVPTTACAAPTATPSALSALKCRWVAVKKSGSRICVKPLTNT